jgi:hypothetical protein
MNGRCQETASRYEGAAVACIDDARRHSDDERMALLRSAGLWLALAALARKLVTRLSANAKRPA